MEIIARPQQAGEYLAQCKYPEAIAIYQQCITEQPTDQSNYWNLGLAWLLQGEELEAQGVWLSAISLGNPEQIEIWTTELIEFLQAVATDYLESGKLQLAETIYWQILELQPEALEIYNILGNILISQNQLESAIYCYEQAINLAPNSPINYHNLGLIFERQGRIDQAITCYQKALAIEPKFAMTYYNLGIIFQKQDQLDQAISYYQQSLQLDPNNALLHNNLGLALEDRGEFKEALECYSRAIELNPNFGNAHLNRGLILIRCGDFEHGFAEAEWRMGLGGENPPLSFPQPLWDGSDLAGSTILLHAEYGFGDTIQFIRYAEKVQACGGKVVVLCPPPLARLLSTCAGINQLVVTETELPRFDVHLPLMSLPYIFKTTLETIPCSIPYLSPPTSVNCQLEPKTNQLKIGIVWAGNPHHPKDRSRSCSLTQFQDLLQISGITFYSLQKGPRALDLAQLPSEIVIQDLNSELGDFADTAAIISQLDLVITVDTAVAHLTGAIGKPVWVLISYVPDNRWLLERSDTPWYPSMRLFRQPNLGDWAGVFTQVTQQLQNLAKSY